MRFKFIGDPRNDFHGPSSVKMGGYEFPRGSGVEVNCEFASRLMKNDHFEFEADTLPEPVDASVPDGWQDMHWKRKVSLAKELAPEMAELIKGVDDAEEIIREHA